MEGTIKYKIEIMSYSNIYNSNTLSKWDIIDHFSIVANIMNLDFNTSNYMIIKGVGITVTPYTDYSDTLILLIE